MAFGRIKLASDETPGIIEILAERPDGELDGIRLNKQGTMAALMWNVKGKNELSFYDLAQNKHMPGPKLPGELAGGLAFFKRRIKAGHEYCRRSAADRHLDHGREDAAVQAAYVSVHMPGLIWQRWSGRSW